jgi:ABC-type lipoprotein export system ATPase subunit
MNQAVVHGPNSSGAELAVEHVSRTYPGGIRALEDVSFRVAPGEIALLTGRSGAGKSTLLNLVALLDRPDSGEILVDGLSLAELPDPARYRREVVGFVFQLHHLIEALTAQENVEIPLHPTALPAADRHRRAREALAEVGMGERAAHPPSQLSGGERQRVAVARALVNGPRLLLADEPTASLDEQSARELLELLGELAATRGCTILLVSHDPMAPSRAARILRLHDGRLEHEERAPQAISQAPGRGAGG